MSTNNLDSKKPGGKKSPDWMDDEPDTEPADGWWQMMPPRQVAILLAIIAAAILAGYALG
jgi:hypothetical protein